MKHSLSVLAMAVSLLVAAPLAHATIIEYHATLTGAAEAPPNASAGTGFAIVITDDAAHTMHVQVTFSGLTGNTTASHIHSATAVPLTGTAGVATQLPTFSGFPLGVTSGTYDHTFDMASSSSWNAAFITANGGTTASAEAALFSGMAANRSYFNIHTNVFPGGEIRGFLQVPEPATLALLALGLAGLGFSRRRKQ